LNRKVKISLSKKYYSILTQLDNEGTRAYVTDTYKLAVADERAHRATKPSGVNGLPPYPQDFPVSVAGKYFVVKWIFDGFLKQHGTEIPATIALKSILHTRKDALEGWAIGARYVEKILEWFTVPQIEEFMDHEQPSYTDMNKEEVNG